jgi:hypothetical protein
MRTLTPKTITIFGGQCKRENKRSERQKVKEAINLCVQYRLGKPPARIINEEKPGKSRWIIAQRQKKPPR